MQSSHSQTRLLLERELRKLKRKLKIGYELEVLWIPDPGSELHGEVNGTTILIYDQTARKSLETLRHEFMDYVLSCPIKLYKQTINKLVQLLNEIAYKEKEQVVEKLCHLLNDPESPPKGNYARSNH